MTAFLLIVLMVVVVVAWSQVRLRLDELRNEMTQQARWVDDRLRGVEQRLSRLERERAANLLGERQASTAAAAPEVQASASVKAAQVAGFDATAAPPASAAGESVPVMVSIASADSAATPPPVANAPAPAPVAATLGPPPALFAASSGRPDESRDEARARSLSLEERLGANWLNKLGIGILVIGLAFFLAYRLQTMGPGGKVFTGYLIGAALLGGGVWLERRQAWRIFARGGIGGGWALIFFTTYAMHHLEGARILSSLATDLVLMLAVAAGMVGHSLRYRSQTVTGLAFLLGYATLITSHVESAEGTVVFSLTASLILALALVVVTTLRHWAWLELGGLVAVLGNHFVWLSLVLPADHKKFGMFWASTGLILVNWAVFRAAYLLRMPTDAQEDRISSLTAIVNAAGVLGLLKFQSAHPEWTFWALAAMGAVELVLGVWARQRRRSAFIVLTTLGTLLLVAAVPFKFHGVSWPILWLVDAHVLAICGLRLGEPVFRRLGLLAGFGAGLVLAFHDVLGLAAQRLEAPNPGGHWELGAGLGLAAALYWLHAEVYPRRWAEIAAHDLEALGLRITSWLGLAAAAGALWTVVPDAWIPASWMALVVGLGVAADAAGGEMLGLEADLLTLAAVAGLFGWDFWVASDRTHHAGEAVAIALLYVAGRRKTTLAGSVAYVAPACTWLATLLTMYWIGDAVPEKWPALAWAAQGLVLFEAGRKIGKQHLRWQGFAAAGVAAAALGTTWLGQGFDDTPRTGWFQLPWPTPLLIAGVVGVVYWLHERTREQALTSVADRWLGTLFGLYASTMVALWLALVGPSRGGAGGPAVLVALWTVALLGLALGTKRNSFQVHGILLAAGVFLYGAGEAVTSIRGSAGEPNRDLLLELGLGAGILLGGVLVAMKLRGAWVAAAEWKRLPDWAEKALARPEQWFFFAAFGLGIVTLATQLSTGSITVGWSVLGLAAFVFALVVGERSFRLGGLALLLLSVVKILLMDVWALAPADRYTTLIVLGCALLAVSFLYTRYREIFRKYL